MVIEELQVRKHKLGLTNEMISEASGVPLSTVQKIFGGVTKAPRKLTLVAIEKALRAEEERLFRHDRHSGEDDNKAHENREGETEKTHRSYSYEGMSYEAGAVEASSILCEPVVNYNAAAKERKYTLDDYYALPDDRRVELIDGVIYDMAAPSSTHQRILGDLHLLFRECSDQHGMPCEVFLSPFDVRLDRDNYTMVQPDLVVICGEFDVDGSIRYEGAPDLTVEILSPSSRMKDQILKLYKYQNAGVREYWIIDPKHRTVAVHYFEEDYAVKIYDFESEIPVGISEGECVIDFSRVGKRPFR
ncbi:MAG: Uma2 family endonuclease [Lachnospiraceae bacterium]|nr:Uma2 family endonuclease [Lachnospiraceae bacterium]